MKRVYLSPKPPKPRDINDEDGGYWAAILVG